MTRLLTTLAIAALWALGVGLIVCAAWCVCVLV